MTESRPSAQAGLAAVLGSVRDVLERRAASAARDDSRKRAAALHRHVADYLIPRAASLEAPLAVVIMGSTGAGKSSLFNALAGKRVSASGVLRPTTREPVLLAAPEDAAALETDTDRGAWARRAQLRIVADAEAGRRGLLLIDAPDIDSVESANRELAAELLEAADLVVYVTTASRYADQVPWQMLERARERGVPLLAVLNRLPPEQADAASVREDYRRLLERGRLAESGAFGALEVVSVVEGEVDAERDALAADVVAPVRAALDHLVRDQDARRELARRALAASLGALPQQLSGIAGEMDAEGEAGDRLLAIASRAYAARRAALGEEIGGGTFLRTEVLREWQAFVGAGRVTQLLTRGIGRITAGIRSFLQPGPAAPVTAVQETAFADLIAITQAHVEEAARRTATAWSDDPLATRIVEADGALWTADRGLADRLRGDLEGWTSAIAARISEVGSQRRGFARAASLGVNVMGTGVILAVFTHTGGLTGAEAGIAAATAVLNQKLLEAIFGEATLSTFVGQARSDLGQILDARFEADLDRFRTALEPLLPDATDRARLREAAAHIESR